MAWKYLNPGDYRLLENYSASYCKNVKSKIVAPVTGIAFSATDSNPTYPINVPSGTKEIWATFTWFTLASDTTNSNYSPRVYLHGSTTKGSAASFAYYQNANYSYLSINNSSKSTVAPKNAFLSRIWLHVKNGVSDGAAEVYRDGELIYSVADTNVMKGEDILVSQFNTRYNNSYVSDIIFSDEPIDLNEHCAVLPIAETSAEGWQYDAVANIYTADSADKTIWQVPDLAQFKKEIGLNNPNITSVAIQAYNVSTNDTATVDTLTKSVKQNGQSVTVDSAAISGSNFISSAMTVNPVTNAAWTLADLSDVQLGITTAKS